MPHTKIRLGWPAAAILLTVAAAGFCSCQAGSASSEADAKIAELEAKLETLESESGSLRRQLAAEEDFIKRLQAELKLLGGDQSNRASSSSVGGDPGCEEVEERLEAALAEIRRLRAEVRRLQGIEDPRK